MRFIYACDVHGDKNKYEKLLEKAKIENIEYIVLGGDLYPKKGDRKIIQPEFIENWLGDYFERLQKNNIKCILIPGNDDIEQCDERFNALCSQFSNIFNINRIKLDIEDISFIGLPDVLDNPFENKNRVLMEDGLEMEPQRSPEIWINKGTKKLTVDEWRVYRETNVEKMRDVLTKLPKTDNNKKTIYVLHDPPYGIGLDMCFNGKCVGSKDIARFIERSNAYMSLHGHIHESPRMSEKWYNKLGNTICIQPGQTEFGDSKMMYVIIDTETNAKERFEIEVGKA